MSVLRVAEWVISGALLDGRTPFWNGALDALKGQFDEEDCGAQGFVEESDYCEGGREVQQRLREYPPAVRVQHGDRA